MTDLIVTSKDINRPEWAVIDIGSNSVRLVIYEGPARSPVMIFNDKMLCGLGDRDRQTGALKPESAEMALMVLRRFRVILAQYQPQQLFVIATAGVRDATDSRQFLKKIKEIGFKPTLLSGDEEARLAALGILSAAPSIQKNKGGGLAGDIGGGSLELCHLGPDFDDWIGPLTSLPLGGLRLQTTFEDDREAARRFIREQFSSVPWLADCPAKTLFAVGGAWRALGRISMGQRNYGFPMLDQYTMSKQVAQSICHFVGKQSLSSLETISGVQLRRVPTLPFAAMVLEELMSITGLKSVCISASGLREGVLFDLLPEDQHWLDPVFELAKDIRARISPRIELNAKNVLERSGDLFGAVGPVRQRLWELACILAHIGVRFHPDERAAQAATTVLSLPFRGLSHVLRIKLAIILFHRHSANEEWLERVVPVHMVDEDDRLEAKQFGCLLRFITEIDPRGEEALQDLSFVKWKDALELKLGQSAQPYWGRGPEKRFYRLAEAFQLSPIY